MFSTLRFRFCVSGGCFEFIEFLEQDGGYYEYYEQEFQVEEDVQYFFSFCGRRGEYTVQLQSFLEVTFFNFIYCF